MIEKPEMSSVVEPLIIPVAGLQYYSLSKAQQALLQGLPLRLMRESDNQYDRHAIRVLLTLQDLRAAELDAIPPALLYDGTRTEWQLGYVPASTTQDDWAEHFAKEMDAAGIDQDHPDHLNAYFDHGSGHGSWSVFLRLEGPIVERVRARVAAAEARRRAERERQEVEWAMRDVWPDYEPYDRRRSLSNHRFEEWLIRRHQQRKADLEQALGVVAERQRRNVRSSIQRQQWFLDDLRGRLGKALGEPGVFMDKTEIRRLKKVQKHLEILSALVAEGQPKKRSKPAAKAPTVVTPPPEPADWEDDIPF